jgi:hypothetical protein
MKLWSILGNSQKLDGGAMYGNVPKAVWSQWTAPDDDNRIDLACRALLVDGLDGKTVLFETGIGAFFEPKLRERYGVVEARHVLLDSLAAAGFGHAPALRPCRRLARRVARGCRERAAVPERDLPRRP